MRAQLIKALNDFLSAICCIEMKSVEDADSQRKPSTEQRSASKKLVVMWLENPKKGILKSNHSVT